MACTISELQTDIALWWRVHVYTYDLRNFRVQADSMTRLDRIVDASYLGTPYFTEEEVARLKATTLATGKTLEATISNTLDERLNRRMKKRVESDDYRVCAAHDLAPIFETAFNIKPKDLAKNRDFLEKLDNDGLQRGETWTGLSTKPRCGPKPRPGKKSKH